MIRECHFKNVREYFNVPALVWVFEEADSDQDEVHEEGVGEEDELVSESETVFEFEVVSIELILNSLALDFFFLFDFYF